MVPYVGKSSTHHLKEATMTATATPAAQQKIQDVGPREQFLSAFKPEIQTTLKVLRAYPAGKESLQPSAKGKNARDLAFVFVAEMGMGMTALTTGFDWSKPPASPKSPEKMADIISALEDAQEKFVEVVNSYSDERLLTETVKFPVGPGKMGDMTKMQFLWMLYCDQIHHRGQFSVYLRMADGKLPSIYGPTADEPWM
jgi:uncharacterized damage-inducible protein DinB